MSNEHHNGTDRTLGRLDGNLLDQLFTAAGWGRWNRGRGLVDAVRLLDVRHDGIDAVVEGTSGIWRVGLTLSPLGYRCTCPDDHRCCKHVVATAFAATHHLHDSATADVTAAIRRDPGPVGPDPDDSTAGQEAATSQNSPLPGTADPRMPVALHVVWDPEEPLLCRVWAETTAYAEHSPGRCGRRPKAPRPHPYAADHPDLIDALSQDPIVAGLGVSFDVIDVTLEATSRIPFPSEPALRAGRPRPRGTLRPALFTVPALTFTGPDVASLAEALALRIAIPVVADQHSLLDVVEAVTNALRPPAPCFEWRAELLVTLNDDGPDGTDASIGDRGPETWKVSMRMRSGDGQILGLESVRPWFGNPSQHAAFDAAKQARATLSRYVVMGGLGELGRIGTASVDEVRVSTDTFLRLLSAQDSLAASGIDLLVPEGIRALGSMHVAATATPFEPGRFGLDALCGFRYTIDADGHRIDPTAFASVAALDRRLVPTPDGLIVLSRSQAAAIRRALSASTVRDALTMQSSDDGVEVEACSGAGWLAQLLDGAPTAVSHVEVGPHFAGELYEYQQLAVNRFRFLADHRLGALLFDEMGLGKTVMGLAITAADHHRDPGIGPTLIVAPTVMTEVWSNEAARFCPHLVCATMPSSTADPAAAVTAGAQIVITTHAKVRSNPAAYAALRWHRVFVDEAHVAKNPESQTHASLSSLDCGQMIVATGTPVQNGLGDLHAVTSLAVPGLLGSHRTFRSRYARPIRDGRHDADRLCGEVMGRISPFMVMRSKADVGLDDDLPPVIDVDEIVALTDEQRMLLVRSAEAAVEKAARSATMWGRRNAALEGLIRAKQICNHPENLLRTGRALEGRSHKYDRLLELIDRFIEAGEKTLVFTQYRVMAELLLDGLGARFGTGRVGIIHGGVSAAERAAFARRLERDELDVIVLTVGAGGVGLTLNAANHVVHYDRWWNPAVEDQATARCHRIGQTRQVTVHRLMCEDSIEMLIDRAVAEKRAVAARLFDASGDNAMARDLALLDDEALYQALIGIAAEASTAR